ncbi:hypothetical protein [Streptomyces parvulus]|uniref:Uncharacterized protein n=1 Tax=Streptomyces parvulus TaxID=146923 RepID=A0A369V5R4_9ACTN|nr:hypothetical protein [Streptomyces parvulus]RDD87555.1 hypothetical protein DVZ84_18105 [Streptomyces parvulus]
MRRSQQVDRARTAWLVTFGLALFLNFVEAWWDPDGLVWSLTRIAVSMLFLLSLAAFITLWWRHRRSTAR